MSPSLPPGPSNALVQTFRYMKDPYAWFPRWRKEYGDPFTLPSLFGDLIVTGDPKGVEQIMSADATAFDVFARDATVPLVGASSVSVVTGGEHTKKRKLLRSSLSSANMRAYGRIIAELAESEIDKLSAGQTFTMLEAATNISLEVIIRAVFGFEDPERIARFSNAVERYVKAYSPSITMMKILRRPFLGIGPWAGFMRATAELDGLINEQIASRRGKEAEAKSILDLLLAARYDDGSPMSDRDVRDQLVTTLFAGHDTTASGAAWASYWVHKDPAIKDRVIAELETLGADAEPDVIAKLPYLNAVCDETLRIRPIAIELYRKLKAPFELKGFTVPAGKSVAANIVLVHNDESLYPDPDRFRPERFLERKFSPFEYIPFGGGIRRCLGAAFAMYEMTIILGVFMRRCRLQLATDEVVVPARHGLTFGPGGGVSLIASEIRPRSNAAAA